MQKIIIFTIYILFILFSLPAHSYGKTYVFFTCDVESTSKGNPELDIWGKEGNNYHGINKMMDILEKHNIKGTFFVNVYEEKKFGEEELQKVCQEINRRGHDVELHTHPKYLLPEVNTMQDAGLDKQIEIISYGKALIYKWINKEVVAHRAGAYGADENTLEACLRNGIFIDSSRNYVYAKYQGLVNNQQSLNTFEIINFPQAQMKLLEIPVTTYYQFKFGKFVAPRILDLESTSLAEFKHIFKEAARFKVGTVVIMSHSFSFSRYNPRVARNIESKMNQLMVLIKNTPELEPATFDTFSKLGLINLNNIQNGNFTPITGLSAAYLKSWERIEQGRLNQLVAFSPFVIFIFGFITIKGVKNAQRNHKIS